MNEHPYDELEALALGDLDPAAQAGVLAHAEACPVCAPILAETMRGVAAMARSDGEITLAGDAGASHALLRRAAAPPRPRASFGWATAAVTAAAALVLGVWNVQLRANAPEVPVDAIVHSHFTHHPLAGPGGSAKLLQALDGSWVYLVADGLHPGAAYELRVNDAVVGDVNATASGTATAYFARPAGKIVSAQLSGPGGASMRWP
jgi:anti-sigma factor RsiW